MKEETQVVQKITYSDLSGSLKFAVVIAYILMVVYSAAFIYGFIQGLGS